MQLERQKGISIAKNSKAKMASRKPKWQLKSQKGNSKAKKTTQKTKWQLESQKSNSKSEKAN